MPYRFEIAGKVQPDGETDYGRAVEHAQALYLKHFSVVRVIAPDGSRRFQIGGWY